ncbi:hypothetical protein [Pseudomonas sp. NBRC 111119]|uniref:hypothetical protein n=1 Tax=Pseudomonas sp. NBRC 111119 TaxID=1661034 RepID=UPI000760D161|nr:hypothetical protein [Pseudomonas sp. NBRC 111119]
MESKKGASAMLEWRARFLAKGALDEPRYHTALHDAQALERAGLISTREWIELVKLANAALLAVG